MPGAGGQVGVASTSGHRASPVTDSLYLSAIVPSDFSNVFQPPMVVDQRMRGIEWSPSFASTVKVGPLKVPSLRLAAAAAPGVS